MHRLTAVACRGGPVLLTLAACVEGGSLAVSAGAPVTAAVQGRITDCARAIAGAEVVLQVRQDRPEQARPVDTRIGPVATSRDGSYLIEVSPSFAVPGPADLQLRVTAGGATQEIAGGSLEFRLGVTPRDTTRFDADLGAERGSC